LLPIYTNFGAVVIGRNEGARLITCLKSLVQHTNKIVYVDSASTDNSLAEANAIGVYTVSLDMKKPFTAARARNAGYDYLIKMFPSLCYIQFVDGDCQVDANWINTAITFIDKNPDVAVVCGRRRERFPNRTIYNQLCDYEWDTPIGETKACGGDALMRLSCFASVGGFRDSLIAGEEPELCVRLRLAGYKIWRLDSEMTLHDANITKFKQWWNRTVRAGYAFAEGSSLHGTAPEYHWVKETRRAKLWGIFLPILIFIFLIIRPTWAMFVVLIYLLQWLRLVLKSKLPFYLSALVAFFTIIGKFAEAFGQIKFMLDSFSKRQAKIIEYK
jgi:GT2 family glycosyltransferase